METNGIRYDWIDSCKGFAIICVVAGHVLTNGFSSNILSSGALNIVVSIIYCFHMPLFFFINGFLQKPYFEEDTRTFFKKALFKVLILLIPYFFFSIVYWATKFFAQTYGATENAVTIKELLLCPIKPIGEYWFLYALIIFSILFLLIHQDHY